MAAAATGVRGSAVEPLAADAAAESARELYERHGGAVFRFCRSRLRSREEAEDASQTTFLYACRALGRGVVPISELSWLLKIAENVCRTRRHDAKRRFALEVPEDPAKLVRIAAPDRAEPELLMPLEDALGRLTEAQRRALLLREWQGLSYREIAARLGIGQGAAEVLLVRARRALAEELEAPGTVRRGRARALDLGWLAGLAKQVFGGGALAGKTFTALAVAIAGTVTAVAVGVLPPDAPSEPAEAVGASTPPSAREQPPQPAAAPSRAPAPVRPRPARRARPVGAAPSQAERPAAVAAATATTAAQPPAERTVPAGRREDPVGVVAATTDAVVGTVTGSVLEPVAVTLTEPVAATVGTASSAVEELTAAVGPVVEPPALPDPPGLPPGLP